MARIAAIQLLNDTPVNGLQYTEQKRSRLVIVHFHDATDTGALGNPVSTSGTAKARVSYAGYYYDAGDRTTAVVDIGTNGGSAWSRPGSVPSRSDTVLVSSVTYDSAGLTYETTDPKAIVARTLYDDLGRTVKTIEHYVDGTVGDDKDKTTEYTYGPAGMTSLTAKLTGGGGQTTEWVYGVTSGVYSNDIVGETRWPDASTGSASSSEDEHVTVNALGQTLTSEDRNGNLRTFGYDVVGRLTDDVLTTLGTNVDGAVRRISTAYDGQGNPYLLTSHDATTSGNIVNQVQRAYNGLGQLVTEWQSHSGAVNTSTSPKVQYAYSEMPSGANHSRLTGMTYPNGRSLAFNYASSLNADISRLSSISDGGDTLEAYDYLGLGTVVARSHPQPGVNLTYIGSPADAGDQYAGLDRFGRIVDQNWDKSGTAVDRYQYAYDRNGNRTSRTNAVNSAFNEVYTYDSLNQIITFNRNSGTRTLDWDYDALGNMESVTTNGGSPATRTHNKQNELTVMAGNSLVFDANGNMTTDETGKQFVYDGWNRVVEVKASGGATLIEYQYDARNYRVVEDDGTAKDLYYSSEWQVLEERVSGNATASYVWSPIYIDAMIARDRDSDANGSLDERLYPTHDANFNVTGLLNTSGSIVERNAYDPFGVATILSAGWSSIGSSAYSWAHQHQGLRLVSVSGAHHVRHREYLATQGRWGRVDPIRFEGDCGNFFRSFGNNPILFVDPTGELFWIPVIILGAALFTGTAGYSNAPTSSVESIISPPKPMLSLEYSIIGAAYGLAAVTIGNAAIALVAVRRSGYPVNTANPGNPFPANAQPGQMLNNINPNTLQAGQRTALDTNRLQAQAQLIQQGITRAMRC
jgi:RHS repeat-associated protein